LTQFVSPDDEHDVLETCRELKIKINTILGNDHLDALFLNVFILRLYMFRAASAHHQEG
jgi:hypothetical protein